MPIRKTIEEAAAHLEEAAKTIIPRRYEAAIDKVKWVEFATTDQARENWWAGLEEANAADKWRERMREVGDAAIRKGMREKGLKVIKDRIISEIPKYKTNTRPSLTAANEAAAAAPPRTRDVAENIRNRMIPVISAQRRARGKPEVTL